MRFSPSICEERVRCQIYTTGDFCRVRLEEKAAGYFCYFIYNILQIPRGKCKIGGKPGEACRNTMSEKSTMNGQILQGSPVPTFVIDRNHFITHWNAACEQATGFAADEMVGTKKQWLVFSREEAPVLADLVVEGASWAAVTGQFGDGVRESAVLKGAWEVERYLHGEGGNGRWLLITTTPLRDEGGSLIGAIETFQDVTDRKQTLQALLETREELEKRVEQRTAEISLKNTALQKEIGERRLAEEELQRSENKFRTVADFTYDLEYWINPEGRFIYISPSCERITGYGRKEFTDDKDLFVAIAHPDDQAELLNHFACEILTEDVCHMDFRIITREGEERWLSHFCQPVFDSDGNHLGRRASNRDITKRKRMEASLHKAREKLEIRVKERTRQLSSACDSLRSEMKARKAAYDTLKESEEELRKYKEFIETILENLPIGLAVHTISDGLVNYMNAKFTEIYGWPKDVICSFDAFFDHVYPDDKYRKVIKKRVVRDIASRDPAKMIWKNLFSTTESGEQRVVTARNIPLFKQDMMISTAQDITEKHMVDEALKFTRFSIDRANDMIYWLDSDGRIVDVNETICKKLQYKREELLSMSVMDIDPALTLESFRLNWESVRNHSTLRLESSHFCRHGEAIPVEIHNNRIEFSGREYNCVFARDITERRELERLVAIQDKMGSLGRVAAGIAHEIRNPLSTINVYLSTLKRLLAGENYHEISLAGVKESIEEMDRASHKIETVVRRVMDFSKPSRHKMQLVDVNGCVRGAVDLSAATLRKSGVRLELKLEENLPLCYMDSVLIEQVMLNLITNALEELAEVENEKRLLVTTAEGAAGERGRSVVITVGDSGSGVAAELRDRIFDPFFTTKHYGSGIGLSICHRIINDHHGTLNVSTSEWGGALFIVEFPVNNGAARR
jgi:PAS domain S-box-containing protein